MANLAYYSMKSNPFQKDSNVTLDLIDFKEMTFRLNYLKDTKGIGLFTGVSGSGKTYTLKQFVDNLNPQLYKVCYLSMSNLTTMDFYRALSIELNLETESRKITMFHNIRERISGLYEKQGVTPVIILDEAQHLKSEVLQDLIMLLNFDMDTVNKCVVVLTGLPSLNTTLSRAVMEPLRQRIVSNYQIVGIEPQEISMYIEKKLASVGRGDPLFTESAINALTSNCQGSIRRLNLLLTHSLNIGILKKLQSLSEDIIFEATQEMSII